MTLKARKNRCPWPSDRYPVGALLLLQLSCLLGSNSSQDCNAPVPVGVNQTYAPSQIRDFRWCRLTAVPTAVLNQSFDANTLFLSYNEISVVSLRSFPSLDKLGVLYLDDNKISLIEPGSFDELKGLKALYLGLNQLKSIPLFLQDSTLTTLDARDNLISEIKDEDFFHLSQLLQLLLRGNKITSLNDEVLINLKLLETLDVSNNPLVTISNDALIGPRNLMELYLSETKISHLPTTGLSSLILLDLQDVPTLWKLPLPQFYRHIQELRATYPFHCCSVHKRLILLEGPSESTTCQNITFDQSSLVSVESEAQIDSKDDPFSQDLLGYDQDQDLSEENGSICDTAPSTALVVGAGRALKCTPEPDAFNPCDDLLSTDTIRVVLWTVAVIAMVCNLIQMVMMMVKHRQLAVYKVLVCQLTVANLGKAVYFTMLVIVDTMSRGEYYNMVIAWQSGWGCPTAGFIATFSTELSMCMLTVIAFERYLLIVHALKPTKHLNQLKAGRFVAASWIYSIIVASLPLKSKFSSYQTSSICLPLDNVSLRSKIYLSWVMIVHMAAFVAVTYFYTKIYMTLRQNTAKDSRINEMRVTRRMTAIIISNFATWIPISFIGFLDIFMPLPVKQSIFKVLLVMAYPLNAITSPFLYAFCTSVFRGEVSTLLSKMGVESKKRRRSGRDKYELCFSTNRSRLSSRTSETSSSASWLRTCVTPSHSPGPSEEASILADKLDGSGRNFISRPFLDETEVYRKQNRDSARLSDSAFSGIDLKAPADREICLITSKDPDESGSRSDANLELGQLEKDLLRESSPSCELDEEEADNIGREVCV